MLVLLLAQCNFAGQAFSDGVGKRVEFIQDGDDCNGQVKQDILLSRLFIKFPLILDRGLIAQF